jgi:Xaa-Pro dipeptidase
MKFPDKLKDVQDRLLQHGLDGWLFYDFRKNNALALAFLEIPSTILLTRRFFYWLPQKGEPVKLVHAIEKNNLDHLPGSKIIYTTWEELEEALKRLLEGFSHIAMEYSPNNSVPYVSKVDGGTLERVRSFGVEVHSSGDLLQNYTSVWDKTKYDDHVYAAKVLSDTAQSIWDWISKKLKQGAAINEFVVQQRILQLIEEHGCFTDEPPIVAVNAHSADPHYLPNAKIFDAIKPGDFVLIDLYCKKNSPGAPFADITRVAVAADTPNPKHQKVFEIVSRAQNAALELVRRRFHEGEPLMGWEVDRECRQVIQQAGYGDYFIHRTGHNLDEHLHGPGANIDNYETQDRRYIIPGTCFTLEPGIYLPGEFGVRLEFDVFVHLDGKVEVNGGVQRKIECLMPA